MSASVVGCGEEGWTAAASEDTNVTEREAFRSIPALFRGEDHAF